MKIWMNYADESLSQLGKGVYVFSDPGGAKPILAYIFLRNISTNSVVISDREYDFFKNYSGINVIKYNNEKIEDLLSLYSPSFVFTGTSYTSKIELQFLEVAKKMKIKTFSFIDHYSNHLERFSYNNRFILPDYICFPTDEIAKISENNFLDKQKLIFPNFHHLFLESWNPIFKKADFLSKLGIGKGKKILLFAPDPLSNVGGVEKFGIDEVTTCNLLIKNLELLNLKSIVFVIKLHPNQNIEYFNNNYYKSSKLRIVFANRLETNDLIYYSDLVIGIFSNLLVESVIMKKNVIRCLIGFKGLDPFLNDSVGECIYDDLVLKDVLIKNIKNV